MRWSPARPAAGTWSIWGRDEPALHSRPVSWILILEQSLNGLQFGLMLFLLAAGLTLVFGIMDMINLAHGSLYMIGAYLAATLVEATGSFLLAVPLALAGPALVGMLLEGSGVRPP